MNWHRDYVDSGCAVARGVGLRCLALEARIQFRACPYAIGGGQSGTGTDFSLSTSGFSVSFISPSVHRRCIILAIDNAVNTWKKSGRQQPRIDKIG
jgi:hypothetical protein